MATTITGTTIDVGPNKLVSDSSGNVTASGVLSDPSGNVRAGRKNLVLNGSMQVAQRNTSTTQHNGYGSDRFEANAGNLDQLAVTLTQNSVTDLPQFTKSLKFTTTTAETNLDSNEYFRIMQKIESQSCQQLAYGTSSAKAVTLSFWIKSSVTGTYALSLFADASAGTRIIGSTYTISSANTWEKKTLTFAGDTVRVMDNNNTEGLRLMWLIGAGSDFTSSDNTSWSAYSASKLAYGQGTNAVLTTANATWEVTGVQFEVGSVATDFEHRSFGETLADCQRYYCSSYKVGQYAGGNHVDTCIREVSNGYSYQNIGNFNFPVQMRTAPTVIIYNPVTGTVNSFKGDGSNYSTARSHPSTNAGCNFYTQGQSLGPTVFISIHATFNAEL